MRICKRIRKRTKNNYQSEWKREREKKKETPMGADSRPRIGRLFGLLSAKIAALENGTRHALDGRSVFKMFWFKEMKLLAFNPWHIPWSFVPRWQNARRLLTFHISDVRDACGRAFLKIFIIGIVGGKTKRGGREGGRGGRRGREEEEEVAAKIFNITM